MKTIRFMAIFFTIVAMATPALSVDFNFQITVGNDKTVKAPPPPPAPAAKGPGHGPPPWAPAHGRRAKYKYRYYPDASVYYDTSRSLYFYLDSDGNWKFGASLPIPGLISGQAHVVLDMDDDKPYKHHHEVALYHPPKQLTNPGKKPKKNKGKGKNK